MKLNNKLKKLIKRIVDSKLVYNVKVMYVVNVVVVLAVLIFNFVIRSITVVQLNYLNGRRTIMELKKYSGIFPYVTAISVFLISFLIIVNFIIVLRASRENQRRLEELRRLFSSAGLRKIKQENKILNENDMIMIEAWNASVEEVSNQTEMREKYFKQMVHDLNAPIQILKMNAQMNSLKSDTKYAVAIEEELQELEDKITDFLYIEKISFFEKPKIEQVNMKEYLQAVGDRFQLLSLNVEITISDDEVLYNTDKTMLEKIVQNLLENALKYGSTKNVVIDVKANQFQVINDIDSNLEIGNIFEKMERQYSQKGNGLGTEIVRTYATLLDIEVTSRSENGKFVVVVNMNNDIEK